MPFRFRFLTPRGNASESPRKRSTGIVIFAALLFILSTAYLLYIPQSKIIRDHSLKVGDIVDDDIIIKTPITFEDTESTEANKERARNNVGPIYEFLAENQTKSRTLIQEWFSLIREVKKEYIKNKKKHDDLLAIKERMEKEFGLEFSDNELRIILSSEFFSRVDLNLLLDFVKSLYDGKIVTSLIGARKSNDGTISLVLKNREPQTSKIDNFYDLKKVKTAMLAFVKEQKLKSPSPVFVTSVLMEFIDVNVSYSMNLTLQAQKKAAAAVNPVMVELKERQVILRKGDEVKTGDLKILKLIAAAAETRQQKLSNFWLITLILFFLTFFGNKFFNLWSSGSINKDKLLVVFGATITVSAVIYRICLFMYPLVLNNIASEISINYEVSSIFFAIPFGFGVLTIAFVFNLQSAVIFSFVNSIIGAITCQWDFRVFLFILISNLAAGYGIEYYQRLKRSPIIKASILWLLPANIILILILHLTGSSFDWMLLTLNIVMGIIAAIVAPILANFLIPLWEIIFQLVTELKLVELTNLNLPIFREMLEKAPGTYHHSLMVASLAEAAAQDLGRSPLLQRAMALYHDIGKIDSPHVFTENHTIYPNPHPSLSPRESAKNIISHIPDGEERAEKLNLPLIVRSAIGQHHGTKLMRYFYNKAREISSVDSDGLDENIFKYPGQRPKDIENAIIMLADQVEAASKSLASPTEEEIKNVISKIIDSNIGESQFDECEGLTFKALNIIANSFHKKLSAIYHMRISYPGFNFKEKEPSAVSTDESGKILTAPNTDRFKALT